jgi:hypothetical protein
MTDRSRSRQLVKASATHGEIYVERVGDKQAEIGLGGGEIQLLDEGELGDLIEALTLMQIGIRRDRMRRNGEIG